MRTHNKNLVKDFGDYILNSPGVWSDSNLVLYLLRTITYSIFIGWAFNSSDQSVFVASMFHYFINLSVLITPVDFGLISLEAFAMISPIIYSLCAIVVVIVSIFVKKSKYITSGYSVKVNWLI